MAVSSLPLQPDKLIRGSYIRRTPTQFRRDACTLISNILHSRANPLSMANNWTTESVLSTLLLDTDKHLPPAAKWVTPLRQASTLSV